MAGWTLWDMFTPYLAARVFGGPVFWQTRPSGDPQIGTDRYHYQLATGLSAQLPGRVYVTAEWAPLGEPALGAELGVRF